MPEYAAGDEEPENQDDPSDHPAPGVVVSDVLGRRLSVIVSVVGHQGVHHDGIGQRVIHDPSPQGVRVPVPSVIGVVGHVVGASLNRRMLRDMGWTCGGLRRISGRVAASVSLTKILSGLATGLERRSVLTGPLICFPICTAHRAPGTGRAGRTIALILLTRLGSGLPVVRVVSVDGSPIVVPGRPPTPAAPATSSSTPAAAPSQNDIVVVIVGIETGIGNRIVVVRQLEGIRR